MHKAAMALVAALLLAAAGPAEQPAEGQPSAGASGVEGAAVDHPASDAAMAFVSEFSDGHLSGMLSRVGGQSEAMRTLAEIDPTMVAAAFDAEIDVAVERHGDAWAQKLAAAWAPLLSDAEMRSLADEGAASPFAEKYLAARDQAAARMAELSQDLFRRTLGEVIGGTVDRLTAE